MAVDNTEDNIAITGTEEADSIKNSGSNVTVDADDGKDTIDNSGNGVVIDAGYGVDSISNGGSQVSVSGGDSGDYINNTGSNSTLNGDGGNDTVTNSAQYVTVFGGAGNDNVTNTGSFTSTDMGSDHDTVDNSASNVTVFGGAGDDSINNEGDSVKIESGEGNDTIKNFDGDSVTVDGGDGNDYIDNRSQYSLILGGAGADTVAFFNDSWANSPANLKVNGDAGDDIIANSGSTVTVDGGADNDSITNSGSNVKVYGKDGDDTISNTAGNVTANGGAGADVITNTNSDVTIEAGKGNDTISLGSDAANNFILYYEGDGDDIIYGFNATSTLEIDDGEGEYSTVKSGNDVIVYVGNSTILLSGAADVDVNISGEEVEALIWRINGTTATFGTSTETQITVNGVKSVDGITRSGNIVTVAESALGTDNVTISDGYTLALATGVTAPSTTAANWYLNGTAATYKNDAVNAGYSVVNNQIVYTPASGGETLVTVNGVKSTGGLTADKTNQKVTVADSALNNSAVTISDGWTLVLGNDVTQTSTTAADWDLNNSTATYTNAYTSAGYKLANNQITYVNASGGNTLATISGVKSLDGISLSGTTVTVSKAALNHGVFSVSSGYTLVLGNDVTQSNSTAAGYKLANNQISYVNESGGASLATVKGIKSTSGLSLKDKVVTVSNAALNQKTVTVNDGYKLKLASDVTKTSSSTAWSYKSNKATYKQTTKAGYALADNVINYTKASTDNLAKVSGDYNLKLGSDVTKPSNKKAAWSYSNGTAIYKRAYSTAGYKLDDSEILYSNATAAKVRTSSFMRAATAMTLSPITKPKTRLRLPPARRHFRRATTMLSSKSAAAR